MNYCLQSKAGVTVYIADLYDNILAAAWVIGGRFRNAFYKNGNS